MLIAPFQPSLNAASLTDWQWDLILDLAAKRDAAEEELVVDRAEIRQYHRDAVSFLLDTGLVRETPGIGNPLATTWRLSYMREVINDYQADIPARLLEKLHTSGFTAWIVVIVGTLAVILGILSHLLTIIPYVEQRLYHTNTIQQPHDQRTNSAFDRQH